MADLAKTACLRCREQKLRCSRDLPICERCARLQATCQFPLPADRKQLATIRAQQKRRKEHYRNLDLSADARLRDSTASVPPTDAPFPDCVRTAEGGDSTLSYSTIKLSRAGQDLLQEVYFSCMFNSSLVFYRDTFLKQFQEGRVPSHVLLAMYASATIFLPGTYKIARQNLNIPESISELKSLGKQWAIKAGREVLQGIDQPTFESVQTCEMLTLYWFSAGDTQRNTMFSGIAYKAACTLGLDSKEPNTPQQVTMNSSRTDAECMKSETQRRCFWAIWFTQCVNSDHRFCGAFNDTQMKHLPLPNDKSLFGAAQHTSLTLSDALDRLSTSPGKDFNNSIDPGFEAELMILILHWVKIRNLIRASADMSIKDWLAELFELDGRLSRWPALLRSSSAYSKRNLYEQLVIEHQPLYIFVHSLYHQCRLVLHAALVPQFSGLCLNERLPAEVTRLSARIALTSALRVSEIAADLLALDWDPAQIPSFVGYCLYVSGSILITLLQSKDAALATLARESFVHNLKLLKIMQVYWTNLERLWRRINLLYDDQVCRARPATVNESNENFAPQEAQLGDLDRVAGLKRDASQLSEPLADSVLGYTLRGLRPDTTSSAYVTGGVDTVLSSAELPHMRQSSVPHNVFANTQHATAETRPWEQLMAGALLQERNDSIDWWQLDLNNTQQPILPHVELFDFDANM